MILSPWTSPEEPLPGIGLHDTLNGRQACPELNSFHQGIGQTCPREVFFSCHLLPKRGQICLPLPPSSYLDQYNVADFPLKFNTIMGLKPPYASRSARLLLHVLNLSTSEIGNHRSAVGATPQTLSPPTLPTLFSTDGRASRDCAHEPDGTSILCPWLMGYTRVRPLVGVRPGSTSQKALVSF